jgi:hypothetical protein
VELNGLPEQFSAEVTVVQGKTIVTKQVFRDHGKLRRQSVSKTATPKGEYWITDWDSGYRTIVWPALKKHMQTPLADPPRFPPPQEPWLIYAPRTVQMKLGQEVTNGVTCTKYLVTNAFMAAWLYTRTVPQLGMELRSTNGILLCSWSNMVVGPQPSELFRVSEGNKNLGMMEMLRKRGELPPEKPGALQRHLAALGLPSEFYVEEAATVLGREIQQRIWCKGDQMRREVSSGEKRGRAIYDLHRGIQMLVEDAKQRVIVMPLILCSGPVGSWEANLLWDGTATIENQGEEVVNGGKLIKRRLSNKKGSAIYYATAQGNVPVKMVSESGVLLAKWENFARKSIPAEMFQVPSSYQQMDLR